MSKLKIKFVVILSELLIILMLLFFCVFNIVNTWNTLTKRELTIYKDILNMQTEVVETEIGNMMNNMINYSLESYRLNLLNKLSTGSGYNYNRILVRNELGGLRGVGSHISGIFVYDDVHNTVISSKDSSISYMEQMDFHNMILSQGGFSSYRKLVRLYVEDEGEMYFLSVYPADIGMIGFWIKMKDIGTFMSGGEYPASGIEATFQEQSTMIHGEERSSLKISTVGKASGIEYSVYLSSSTISGTVLHIMIWDIVLTVISFIVIVGSLSFLRYKVVGPISYMRSSLKRIGDGDESLRLGRDKDLFDYQKLYGSFNMMMDRTSELNRELLTEQEEKSRIYSSYLALQLNPHFYVSYLNIISGLARVKNFGLIEQITGQLSDYLRYMFGTGNMFVLLKDELSHIQNYMNIQSIRYAAEIGYREEVSEDTLYISVPRFLLFTFIENSVKYSGKEIGELKISVFSERQGNDLVIRIRDNGNGFSEDILELINGRSEIVKEDGEHIGIRNLKERVMESYGLTDCIKCSNEDGARIDIRIPVHHDGASGAGHIPHGTGE